MGHVLHSWKAMESWKATGSVFDRQRMEWSVFDRQRVEGSVFDTQKVKGSVFDRQKVDGSAFDRPVFERRGAMASALESWNDAVRSVFER